MHNSPVIFTMSPLVLGNSNCFRLTGMAPIINCDPWEVNSDPKSITDLFARDIDLPLDVRLTSIFREFSCLGEGHVLKLGGIMTVTDG